MRIASLIIALLLATLPDVAGAKLKVVASTNDLASIAEFVGGNEVSVRSIVRGGADPHFVEVLPSHMLKIARADVYLKVGMDLDYWAGSLIDGANNNDLIVVDCSVDVRRMEVPTTPVDASMGDVHVQGNPHYWLNPENGRAIARTIAGALSEAEPGKASLFDASLQEFIARLDDRIEKWKRAAEAIRGKEIITYHNSWPYLSDFLGFVVVGFVEPKPGIEPTPSHKARLIDVARNRGVRLIGREPYFSERTPKAIARETGAAVVTMPTSVKGVDSASDYLALFDTLVELLTSNLAE